MLSILTIFNLPVASSYYAVESPAKALVGEDERHMCCLSLSECSVWLACSQFEVKDVAWDDSLGADRLDLILLNHFADEFREKHGFDIRTSPKAIAKLKRQVLTRLWCNLDVPQQ